MWEHMKQHLNLMQVLVDFPWYMSQLCIPYNEDTQRRNLIQALQMFSHIVSGKFV